MIPRRRADGHTLVELLIALALAGLLLMVAVAWLETSARQSREVQATLELAESAGFAIDQLERAVRNAGSFGMATADVPLAGSTALGTLEPSGLAPGGRCVPGLALDLRRPLQWRLWEGGAWPPGCLASPGGRAVAGSAVLVTRSAIAPLTPADEGTLWLESWPTHGVLQPPLPAGDSRLQTMSGAASMPPSIPARTRLEVEVYYVSRDSTGRRDWPSLRRKRLVGGLSGARFEDEELVPGVTRLSVFPGPTLGDGTTRLLELVVLVASTRSRDRVREARRYVWIRNGAASPWP